MISSAAQNRWVSPFGEDYLQLLSSCGGNVLGGIDSTGAPYGAMLNGIISGSAATGFSITPTAENITALTINSFDANDQAPCLTINGSSQNVAVLITSTFSPNNLGYMYVDNSGKGFVVAGTTDGGATKATLSMASDNTFGVTLLNSAQDAGFNLKAGVITATGSMILSGQLTSYNGITTANGGIPVIVPGPVKLTSQSAAKAAQLIFATGTTPGAGFYRISYVATVTTADATSLTLGGATGFQVIFTNANGDSVVKTSNPTTPNVSSVNATGTTVSGSLLVYAAASTDINYNFGYSAGTGNFRYDLVIFAEYLGA